MAFMLTFLLIIMSGWDCGFGHPRPTALQAAATPGNPGKAVAINCL